MSAAEGPGPLPPPGGEIPRLSLSVIDFTAPLVPTGSLRAGLSVRLDEEAMAQGARLHARIQARLKREQPDTRTEQTVQVLLEHPELACLVRGRLDVLIPGTPERVEEIKTTYQPAALLRALEEEPLHPYLQQLRMYAWIQGGRGTHPVAARLRVVSLVDTREHLVDVPFEAAAFGAWVEAQLAGLAAARRTAQARAARRRALGAELAFPFASLREGQARLMDLAGCALAEPRPLLVQAPTGLGKTAALLFPALQKALAEDLRVVYATPRNSQHGVAEAFVRALGGRVHSVTLRAKERCCPQEEVHCHPDICPRADGYYDRLAASGVLDALEGSGCADPAVLKEHADRHLLCPFELALDASRNADVVIGDYNYVLSPSATLQRLFGTPEAAGRNLVLLDEAHNLPARACDWFSPALEMRDLEALRRGWKGPLKARVTRQAGRCLKLLEALQGPHRRVDVAPDPFLEERARIRALAAQAAAEGQALAPGHPLVQLFRLWSDFCGVLEEPHPSRLLTWIPPGRLQITCADASRHLAARLEPLAGLLAFSATLKPFEYYRRLGGLPETAWTHEEASPFPPGHRLTLAVPQVSTLLRRREAEVPRVAQVVSRVLPLRRGNYLVFFPSFDFLERTLPLLDLPGFRVEAQPRRASGAQIDALLEALRRERGLVVLAVQGGSLAEGIDLPGEQLIGCVVVGPPLPPFELERQLVKAYFDGLGGEGEHCAYTYPAMARAVQAAGRVIRGPQDRGLVLFLDPRFLEEAYAGCFPRDWYRETPREWISRGLLADIAQFWEGAP